MVSNLLLVSSFLAFSQAPSALPAGTKLPPYSFLLSIGEQRGRSHCYVCESLEKPVLILFVRSRDKQGQVAFLNSEMGKLALMLDEALPKREPLATWLTICDPKQDELDSKIVSWAATTGLRHLPVGVFEDPLGPPAYRLNGQAQATAIIARDGKVDKAVFWKEGETAESFQKALIAELDRIAPEKKAPPKEPAKKEPAKK